MNFKNVDCVTFSRHVTEILPSSVFPIGAQKNAHQT